MDIGIQTYHWAPNFGAQLQTFSTVLAVRKAGHTPHVIDWVPEDAYQAYSKQVSPEQMECHKAFAAKYFNLTARCRTPEEITAAIDAANIGHVIIGSDSLFNLLKPTFHAAETLQPDPDRFRRKARKTRRGICRERVAYLHFPRNMQAYPDDGNIRLKHGKCVLFTLLKQVFCTDIPRV